MSHVVPRLDRAWLIILSGITGRCCTYDHVSWTYLFTHILLGQVYTQNHMELCQTWVVSFLRWAMYHIKRHVSLLELLGPPPKSKVWLQGRYRSGPFMVAWRTGTSSLFMMASFIDCSYLDFLTWERYGKLLRKPGSRPRTLCGSCILFMSVTLLKFCVLKVRANRDIVGVQEYI